MIIKPPKPGLGFGFWDLGFGDLVWLGLGVAIIQDMSARSLSTEEKQSPNSNQPIRFRLLELQEQRRTGTCLN